MSAAGIWRVEAQATESYDDIGLIYAFAVVDTENNVTCSSSATEATFTQSALNLKGISAQDLNLSSNEADGTSITADVAFTC
ncbi:hypothetical protein GCM10011376_07120 [Nocardioides flavus (ex Wang et al. 2016)]|uniref:Uncharacterized protein n=1 Tax=Nocardioides flavus (ex Wang et al. 2016) TaxID=2058780 RepID=A0ABQ3HHH1_9ACTN|nr:hypothetical protein [Nocardioides flavus (ex Wang et al. 2016)]GHE16044.1 hypothetical protein GCM10011376_07120 [Nocardioides flavus (ex Wang et al. 2016)]